MNTVPSIVIISLISFSFSFFLEYCINHFYNINIFNNHNHTLDFIVVYHSIPYVSFSSWFDVMAALFQTFIFTKFHNNTSEQYFNHFCQIFHFQILIIKRMYIYNSFDDSTLVIVEKISSIIILVILCLFVAVLVLLTMVFCAISF